MTALPAAHPLPYHAVNDLGTLASMLDANLRTATVDGAADSGARTAALLDAFICAAGMWQVVDDRLHRDIADLTRVAKYAARLPGGSALAGVLRAAVAAGRAARWSTWEAPLAALSRDLRDLAAGLADHMVAGRPDHCQLLGRSQRTLAMVSGLAPAHRRSIAIPPRCFFSFDQRPEDCFELATRFAERWPTLTTPLLVVGVRTSGSYLAPLVAAQLRRLGYERVDVMSWRPSQPLLGSERRALAHLGAAGGMALLVDDPPTSGGSLARVADELERAGLAPASLVFLLQTFDSPGWWEWPKRLAGRQLVLLPFQSWSIWARLEGAAVRDALQALLPGTEVLIAGEDHVGPSIRVRSVLDAVRLPMVEPADVRAVSSGREHIRAVFRTRLQDGQGVVHVHHVLARGTGLGHFGEQSLAVARSLEGLVPQTYGTHHGLLFRAWLPERLRADGTVPPQRLATAQAAYVAARRSRLPVAEDVSAHMEGHDAVWESCSRWAGAVYGRLALFVRPALHQASRRLLSPRSTSLIDGGVERADWFDTGELLKAGFEERVFRYQIPLSYDSVYDLAAAAATDDDPSVGERLRQEYSRLTGEDIDDERWFLYGLLYLREHRDLHIAAHLSSLRHRDHDDSMADGARRASRDALVKALNNWERMMSRAHVRYFGQVYFADLEPPTSGPLCAVDIDGVLETGSLSYPGTTPAGALALRALARHGYRAVLASGRSLAEVRERCTAYRLAGGVAEYGAAVFDPRTGGCHVLLDADQLADLSRARAVLSRLPGVVVDPLYRHGVRAWRLDGVVRRALDTAQVEEALVRAGVAGRVYPIPGWSQTDFAAAGVDKGSGLRALAALLGEPAEGRFMALAVGDSPPDQAMFAHARLAAAPANVDPAVRAARAQGLSIQSRPYQAGLLQAVARLLGHGPARCRTCTPRLEGDQRLLITLLAAADRSRPGKLLQGLRLAVEAARG